jgi:hypothetical protein
MCHHSVRDRRGRRRGAGAGLGGDRYVPGKVPEEEEVVHSGRGRLFGQWKKGEGGPNAAEHRGPVIGG